jgi:hypothetical protein
VLKHAQVEASPLVAARLRVAPGAPVTEIHRVRWLDREPVSFEITYLPPAIGDRLRGENLAERDIFLILETDYGLALATPTSRSVPSMQMRRWHKPCAWTRRRPAAHRAPDVDGGRRAARLRIPVRAAATPSSTPCACRAIPDTLFNWNPIWKRIFKPSTCS